MKRKSLLYLLLLCITLPCMVLMSGCKKDPPQNVELNEFRNIAVSIIQYFKNFDSNFSTASTLNNGSDNSITRLSSSSELESISSLQSVVKNYPYKERVANVAQYREAMYEQLFYLPIACGEVLFEEFGVVDFYGSKVKFFDDTIIDESGTSHRTDSYFYIDKIGTQIIITIYEEFFENDVFVNKIYNYITLNYVSDSNFDAKLVSYTDNLDYLSYMYLDSDCNFIEVKYDCVNMFDPLGNIIETFETLSSDGADSYITSDKTISIECKDILVEMDDPNLHTAQVISPKDSVMYEIHIDKINNKMEDFRSTIEEFEQPAPLFTVIDGILVDINYHAYYENEVITIPSNVTTLLFERLTLSPNVKKVVLPSSVEKIVVEKDYYDNWKKTNSTQINPPLINNRFYELPLEILNDISFTLFSVRYLNDEQQPTEFDINNVVIGDECKLLSRSENGNTYLKIRSLNAIQNDDEPIDYLIGIRNYQSYFGENYVLNIEGKAFDNNYSKVTRSMSMFPNTERRLADKLLCNSLKYARTVIVTVIDPLYPALDEICVASLVEHYGLQDNMNLDKFDTCIFKIENFIITDNTYFGGSIYGFSIRYIKEIKNLTIKSNNNHYMLQSAVLSNDTTLQSHKFDNIIIEEGNTGISFGMFNLQTENISFPSTIKDINFTQCNITYNNDLYLPLKGKSDLPSAYATDSDPAKLKVNGNIIIDASNCNDYIHLGTIIASGDFKFIVSKEVRNFYYNSISAKSALLSLNFSRSDLNKMDCSPYTLGETLNQIINDENTIFTVEFMYSFNPEVSEELTFIEDMKYSYNVRNNTTSLNFSEYITAPDAIIKASTINSFEGAQSPVVSLSEGNNTFYVFAKDNLSEDLKTFVITVYRNKMFKFIIDTQGGEFTEQVETERDIEENVKNYFNFPEYQPLPQKYGHYFYTWHYDPTFPSLFNPSTSMLSTGVFSYDEETMQHYLSPSANVTIYAIYEVEKFTINYIEEFNPSSSNNATNNFSFTSEVVRLYTIFDEDFNLPTNVVYNSDPDNYEFIGWYTHPSLSDEHLITRVQTSTAEHYSLYAKFDLIPRSVVYKYKFLWNEEYYNYPADVAAKNPSSIKCGFTDSTNTLNFLKNQNGGSLFYPEVSTGEFYSLGCKYDETIKQYTVIATYKYKTFGIFSVPTCTIPNCTRCEELGELEMLNFATFDYSQQSITIQLNPEGSYHNALIYVDKEMTTLLSDVLNTQSSYWSTAENNCVTFNIKKYYEDTGIGTNIYLYFKLV